MHFMSHMCSKGNIFLFVTSHSVWFRAHKWQLNTIFQTISQSHFMKFAIKVFLHAVNLDLSPWCWWEQFGSVHGSVASQWAQLASCKRNQTLEKITLISASRSSGSLSRMIRDASNSNGMWVACLIEKPTGRSICLIFDQVSAFTHMTTNACIYMHKTIQMYLFATLQDLMAFYFILYFFTWTYILGCEQTHTKMY